MISQTYGRVTMDQIAEILIDRAKKDPAGEYNLVIGTDSQNFDYTKVVVVIALHHVGKGGLFFYEIKKVKRISDIRQKLYFETNLSLECAKELIDALERQSAVQRVDFKKFFNFSIHVDAGENGPTQKLIPELVGWIRACGYKAAVKPNSYAASSIADTLSK